jgi:transcriptional regulator with XRE-family HTH domain
MGHARLRPERLGEKLRQIRLTLGLSQSVMLRHIAAEDLIVPSQISEYESGRREPPLPILLRYARAAGVPTEVLIDDELDLPERLPGPTDHEAIKRQFAPRRAGRQAARKR